MASPQQPREGMERDLARVRVTERREHVDTTRGCHRRDFAHQTALANARWPDHAHHAAMAVGCTVQ